MAARRRKLARKGDVISYSWRTGERRGTVIGKRSDYLVVRLDAPRELEDYEVELKLDRDPYEDTVHNRSGYTIVEYAEDREEKE